MTNSGYGLRLEPPSISNVYRRNTARGNSAGDFLDYGLDNTSHGVNYMPGQM